MRKISFLSCLLIAVSATAILYSSADAATTWKICKKNSNGAIRVTNKCKSSETTLNNISLLTGPTGPAGATGATGPEGPNKLAAFASVTSAGDLNSTGGSMTTSAGAVKTTNLLGVISYTVSFFGNYTSLTDTDTEANRKKVSVLMTTRSSDYGIGNAIPVSAKKTEIIVHVYPWKSDAPTSTVPGPSMANAFDLAVLLSN